ncbi:unnamed protein product [Cylindrotheca closterium]|uniref:PS II complex 12 kDa extrinsic protein n=1 Tax=Cylindrotheca closterium TaxID=2856 RepID=A0AAD2FSN0_9STRA|nr:unnamed protein product [Cylindrotheca closterium]
MMKLFSFFALAVLFVSSANALAPAHTNDRRAFLSKVATSAATVAAVSTLAAPAAFAKQSNYDLDVGDTVVPEKEVKKSGGGGGSIVGGALAGGLLLSLPFFAPNLARMAGVKNAKLPKK